MLSQAEAYRARRERIKAAAAAAEAEATRVRLLTPGERIAALETIVADLKEQIALHLLEHEDEGYMQGEDEGYIFPTVDK